MTTIKRYDLLRSTTKQTIDEGASRIFRIFKGSRYATIIVRSVKDKTYLYSEIDY